MFYELPDEAIAPPLTRRLRDRTPCAPSPAQEWIIRNALALARELGLTIPRERIIWSAPALARELALTTHAGLPIFTVEADNAYTVRANTNEPMQPGEFDHDPRTRAIRVWLNVGLGIWPENLKRTTLHEMCHVHDAVTGRAWDRVAWERRAIAFAEDAMRSWR